MKFLLTESEVTGLSCLFTSDFILRFFPQCSAFPPPHPKPCICGKKDPDSRSRPPAIRENGWQEIIQFQILKSSPWLCWKKGLKIPAGVPGPHAQTCLVVTTHQSPTFLLRTD